MCAGDINHVIAFNRKCGRVCVGACACVCVEHTVNSGRRGVLVRLHVLEVLAPVGLHNFGLQGVKQTGVLLGLILDDVSASAGVRAVQQILCTTNVRIRRRKRVLCAFACCHLKK